MKKSWVGWLFTQGGGLFGLALGYCRAAPPGLRQAHQSAGPTADSAIDLPLEFLVHVSHSSAAPHALRSTQ